MPQPTQCSCGAPRSATAPRCDHCDAGPAFTRMRLLRCTCGVRRPGDEVTCPACGRAGGDEVMARVAGGSTAWPARVAEVTTRRQAPEPSAASAVSCGICGFPMAEAAGSSLRTCEVCDVPVATVR